MFWEWQAELWVFAIPMALVFEGSRLIQLRWHLSVDDFRRISSLCTMLMLSLLVYLYVSDTSAYFVYMFISWLPVVIFPLLVAQAYATSDRIEIWTLFLFKRNLKIWQQF
jgi:hypothetical protein